MGYQRARTAYCDHDDCSARQLVLPPVDGQDEELRQAGWTIQYPLTYCPAHSPAPPRPEPPPLSVRDIAFTTFNQVVAGAEVFMRATHIPTRTVVERSGRDRLAVRGECMAELQRLVADAG